jgi:hypothetical protein
VGQGWPSVKNAAPGASTLLFKDGSTVYSKKLLNFSELSMLPSRFQQKRKHQDQRREL